MKPRKLIFLAAAVLFMTSCSIVSKRAGAGSKDELSSPVMPFWLNGDSTDINVSDIFPNPNKEVFFLLGEPEYSYHLLSNSKHNKVARSAAEGYAISAESIRVLSLLVNKVSPEIIRVKSYNRNKNSNSAFHGAESVLNSLSLVNATDKTRCDIVLKKSVRVPVVFSYRGKSSGSVTVKGDFNSWNPVSHPLKKVTDSFYSDTFMLNPGEYAYQLVVGGNSMLDPSNSQKRSNGMGGENSVIHVVENRISPKIMARLTKKGILIQQTESVFPSKPHLLALWDNRIIYQSRLTADSVHLSIPKEAKNKKRSYIRVFTASEYVHGNDILIPLEYGKPVTDANKLERGDLEKTVMYFAFVDRFYNADSSNDRPLKHPQVTEKTNFQGGDIAGITSKIKDGYFDSLGCNAIWISPISANPKGAWGDFPDPKVKFSAYHGYWPVSNILIDRRFGNAAQLRTMLNAAHSKNNNVYLDYVAHHVHKEHPIYKLHPDWVTPLYLPDGRMNTELWDEQRLTTWFDTFLPTLDLGKPEIAAYMVDSALYWLREFEFDGFRHDATKHIPDNFTRLLTSKIRTEIEPMRKRRMYQIGETYGSPELIGSYLGQGLLDAQFDFNLYDAMLRTFAQGSSLQSLVKEQKKSIEKYGSHHLMGNISGNQDKPRFMSWADGSLTADMSWNELKKIGHTRDLPLKSDTAYSKFLHFYTWLFSSPGIPVIYYGDEIGMTGANDPGNRNMMQFSGLNSKQAELKRKVSELAKIRTGSMALCYGDYNIVSASDSQVLICRRYLNEMAVIAINQGKSNMELKDLGKYLYEWYGNSPKTVETTAVWSTTNSTALMQKSAGKPAEYEKLKAGQSAIMIYTYQ
jgi:glycosidase